MEQFGRRAQTCALDEITVIKLNGGGSLLAAES
jgi:hypothetical protein